MGGLGNVRPARFFRHKKHVLLHVAVAVFLISIAFGDELLVALVEAIGEVLQEDEAQHDVLVLGGVEVAAQHVRRVPQLLLEAYVGGVLLRILLGPCHTVSSYPSLMGAL